MNYRGKIELEHAISREYFSYCADVNRRNGVVMTRLNWEEARGKLISKLSNEEFKK